MVGMSVGGGEFVEFLEEGAEGGGGGGDYSEGCFDEGPD